MRKRYIIKNLQNERYLYDFVKGSPVFVRLDDVNHTIMEFNSEEDAFSYMEDKFNFEYGYYTILPVIVL